MKRKIGIGLLCLLAVCAAVAAGGYWYLFQNIDEETKGKIDQEIGAITDKVNEQIQAEKDRLEQGTTESGSSDGGDSIQTQTPDQEQNQGQNGGVSGTPISKTDAITDIYYGGMEELERQGNAIVNQLLSNAKADYKSITESGGGKDQLMSLASAYSNQASAMESGMDAAVEGLLSQMKRDLTSEGMSSNDADRIVSQMRDEYKAKKKARYDEVYAQFQAALK